MQLDPISAPSTLDHFHASWDLERIANMDLAEYADLSDHDSLCYWLEYGTRDLGAIGGIALHKFELWHPETEKEFRDKRFNRDAGYAWNRLKGDTLNEAFVKIRNLLVQIVTYSKEGNWEGIENIRFHAIGKWKIAFLFSGERLLPVYSKRALTAIASGLGFDVSGMRIFQLQEVILSLKTEEEDVIDYSYRMYDRFANRKLAPPVNYYLIGSKYEQPVIKDFLKHQVVGIGWLDWLDFSSYMGGTVQQINKFVADNYKDVRPALHKIQSYFRLLSQIKAGDIIAVKSQGAFGQLQIIAYAEVVERDGVVYYHDPARLGHHIHVNFLDSGFKKGLERNYAGTLHQLTAQKDKGAFHEIFGWYGVDAGEPEDEDHGETDSGGTDNGGYNEKGETDYERNGTSASTVRRIHNRIQNRFFKFLDETYPDDKCGGEKSYRDAYRITDGEIFIYEIKPSSSAYTCIRQGIGQLLDYRHKDRSGKEKHIVVVGPNEPKGHDLKFLKELQLSLKNLTYIAFNEADLTAKQY